MNEYVRAEKFARLTSTLCFAFCSCAACGRVQFCGGHDAAAAERLQRQPRIDRGGVRAGSRQSRMARAVHRYSSRRQPRQASHRGCRDHACQVMRFFFSLYRTGFTIFHPEKYVFFLSLYKLTKFIFLVSRIAQQEKKRTFEFTGISSERSRRDKNSRYMYDQCFRYFSKTSF